MEVYRAIADFQAPSASGLESHNLNLLSFCKGDEFEVLDTKKTDWWGARRLADNSVGYVPAKYLQYAERRIGKLLPDNHPEHRENQLKTWAAMQNSPELRQPAMDEDEDDSFRGVDIPSPDYDPDTPGAQRNSFQFVDKFKNVIVNIRSIEELYDTAVAEPDPDYLDDDSSDFPPPPPPIAANGNAGEPPTPTSPLSSAQPTIIGVRNGSGSSPEEEGELVQPRRLVNPCLASKERQALHKELLMNYKLGKDVLQKPELNKILAKRKETQKRKEWQEQQASKRTSFELKLEERANRLKDEQQMNTISEDAKAPEFVQMHRRITHKTPTSPPT